MKGYKAYNKGMTCKGIQFKEGETYEHDGKDVCCQIGAQLAASGNSSQLAAFGYSSQLAIDGKESVGAGIGINNIIKGKKGCWITLAEWIWNAKKCRYIPVCVKSAQIEGKILKANTWYKLESGEFVEAK